MMFPAGCLTQGQPFSSASIRSNRFTFFYTSCIPADATANKSTCWVWWILHLCLKVQEIAGRRQSRWAVFFCRLSVVFCNRCWSSIISSILHMKSYWWFMQVDNWEFIGWYIFNCACLFTWFLCLDCLYLCTWQNFLLLWCLLRIALID